MERFDEGKVSILGARQDENVSGIAPGKISEYLAVFSEKSRSDIISLPNWTLRFFTPKMAPNPVLAREIPKRTKNS